MKTFLRILKYFTLIVIILMILSAAYDFYALRIKKEGTPIVFGYAKMIVTQENEIHKYKNKSILILKQEESYETGDYLASKNAGEVKISQVGKKDGSVYYILNDEMSGYDKPIVNKNIIGKVIIHFPKMSGIVRCLSSIFGITILILFFVGVAIMEFVKKEKKKKKIEKVREMYLIPDAVDSITAGNIKKRKEKLEKKKEERKWEKKLEPKQIKIEKKKKENDVNKQIDEENKYRIKIFSKTKGKHSY